MIQSLLTLSWLSSQRDNPPRALAHMLGPFFLVSVTCLVYLSLPPIPSHAADDNTYLRELQARATQERLFAKRYWHLLLHYRPNLLGGHTSEVDDPGFFLSKEGKQNPKAELMETLRYFFSDKPVGRSQQPAQCAFIARYHWLQTQLNFDSNKLSSMACQRFDVWLSELNPQSISIIFPSAFMNNPASMFGHTFFRINQVGQTEQTRILAYTINYAAELPPDVGLDYAWKGIFGGYKGFFSTFPYYMKVKEYRDIENRDIWEYQLTLTPEQIHRMLMHTWELGNAYFDYFFFKENCAYHILSLLEVANPKLYLTNQYIFWTVPADTIRAITEYEGLVDELSYRPARSTQIQRKREKLTKNENLWLDKLTADPTQVRNPQFKTLPQDRQVFLMDLASDYLHYKGLGKQEQGERPRLLGQPILLERSKVKVPSPRFNVRPYTTSPETGHHTSRASIGMGWREDEFFEELSIRAGYHDLLDPDTGYTRDAQIELLAATFRHYEKRNQFRLDQFTFAKVVSLSPIDTLFQTPSWKFNIGMETIRMNNCKLCSNGNFNLGIGAATETQLLKREVYFAFAEMDANISGAFDEHHRVGAGTTGGIVTNLTDNWKALLSIGYFYYPLGDQSDDFRFSIGQRYTLSQNWALRTEFNHRDDDNEVILRLQAFF
ncbi:MAG: hypothetical protein NPIRA04_14490 [Nitrospirales bacterium]|nr:MAG: hypothetical protein NPIRA04_14490 [Nitrospirales bacterium]